ncbi:ABC transporter ATP-binding protein [Paenarthrobacter nicotinovorans]|uniref:ABC transporter ATP-binding protein n=1 Tax=Paenarthrobacter nicotinovorans TaxID=29320 RepID=A0ABV0GQM9_PAENI|nr:ABC transporter ATP-binding protein [Paenarthrobacter nicotinovorans]
MKTTANTSRRAGLTELFRHVAVQRRLVVLIVILSLLGSALSLAQPLLVREVIDRVSASKPLELLPWLVGGLILVGGVLGGIRQYLIQRTAETAIRRSRHNLIDHILHLPVPTLDQRRVGDLVARVTTDTTVIRNMLSQGFVESFAGVFTIIGALVAMLFLDPVLVIIALGAALVSVAAVVWVTSYIERASLGVQTALGKLSSSMDRAIRATRTVRAANASTRESQRVKEDANSVWTIGLRVAATTALVSPISSIAMQVTFLAVIGVGGLRVASGELTVADLVSFILFLFLLIMPLGQLFGTVSAIGEALGGVARINEILQLPTERDTPVVAGNTVPTIRDSSLVFRGVSFEYDHPSEETEGSSQRSTLSDVSFQIGSSQRVAIVGPSGAGKSTILNLIARFYDASDGQILFGGTDVNQVARSAVRANIAYVEQDAPAVAGTLRDNLNIGSPDASDEDMMAILERLNLTSVLRRSELGLDAEVGEGAVLLSGGERQRIAVARALLANPSMLLLDESTSNLDGVSEEKVRELIADVTSGCTLVIVAHRLATVQSSDLILVLDEGKVVASGTHTELMQTSPLYRELAQNQFLTNEMAYEATTPEHDAQR